MVTTDYSRTRREPGLRFSVHAHWHVAIVARRLIARSRGEVRLFCVVGTTEVFFY